MITKSFKSVAPERPDEILNGGPLMGAPKLTKVINRKMVLDSMAGVAAWMRAGRASAPHGGKSHRMAVYNREGAVTWMYPNSNTGESISAWLDLAEYLECPRYQDYAIEYGKTLIEDKKHGLYGGLAPEALGLMWYWTDIGTYSSLYAMRVPCHFIRLHALTGDTAFLEASERIGDTLVRHQLPSGLVGAGWSEKNGWAESGDRIGSRFVYVCATYATMYRLTGEARYQRAFERALEAMLKMQCEDGSFYQNYDPQTLQMSPSDSSTKCMFFAYILNGIAEAYEVFADPRLLDCARRLGDYIVKVYYCRGALPYCIGKKLLPADGPEANMSMYECSNGLLWLYRMVPDLRFLDIGLRLWVTAWYNQAEVLGNEELNGAILIGSDSTADRSNAGIPSNRKHLAADSSRAAKCVLWGMVNHVFASKRLLESDYIIQDETD